MRPPQSPHLSHRLSNPPHPSYQAGWIAAGGLDGRHRDCVAVAAEVPGGLPSGCAAAARELPWVLATVHAAAAAEPTLWGALLGLQLLEPAHGTASCYHAPQPAA